MPRLLHMIDSLGLGGAEQLLVAIINNLKEFEHHIITLNGPDELRQELTIDHHFLNLHKVSHRQLFRHAKQVRQYIRQHRIDMVHSHLYFSNILARLAVPASVPLFNSLHTISSLDNYCKHKLTLYIDQWTYRKRHHIIAVSKQVMDDYKQWVGLKGPATILDNFIDDVYFQASDKTAISTHPLRLVAIGNLKAVKNYGYLLAAFKHLSADVTLDIYGEGGLRPALEKEIAENNLPVRLMGAQKQLHKVLPAYDAFVMSSLFEGGPLTLLQAVASGLPAIVSDIPRHRDVMGDHAVYFSLHDPMDLVSKLNAILSGELPILHHVKPALDRISSFAKKDLYLSRLRQLYQSKLAPVQAFPSTFGRVAY
jgi:L-malate glycosyltransferase